MTDKSTPTRKNFSPNEKNSNNLSTSTNIQNTEINLPDANFTNINEVNPNKNSQIFTFRIIKRRAPWSKKEDEALTELVNKYGKSNWTIIANEMGLIFQSKHRNGKQCRERWHNHLDPIVNKENWTEAEENILFNKHMEYGNKWSDISKYLPGRTDNSIKNHFYSKLRKFIRKILKQINKENLLKNNGIDSCKYNSDKIYKLLKKYKVTYNNVNKDTILDLIISTEKKQKGKIFGLNDENKKINDNDINKGKNNKINPNLNTPFNLDNNSIQDNNEKINRNTSGTKRIIFTKKTKGKSKVKKDEDNEDINGNNKSLLKKEKKIFQSNIVTEFKTVKDDVNVNQNKNKTSTNNEMNIESTKIERKYKKKIKKLNIINDNNTINNNNNNDDYLGEKKLTINPDIIEDTYPHKFKRKNKSRIKDKETGNLSTNDNKKLLNKKRRKKKRRKVTISLSTPENKKTQISRIMPKKKFIFGMPVFNKSHRNNKNKQLCPEDFDPMINDVERVREGLEIHSKSIIVINKCLLTEKVLPEINYQYKPNLNLTIPLSPRIQQFPSIIQKTTKNGEDNNYFRHFNDKNISIGLPTPMDGYYEPQISPVALNNLMIYGPPSTKNVYNVDFRYENSFLRNNIQNSFIPKGYINNPILTPNTPKREINLQNKIVIQNNSNITGTENNDGVFIQQEKFKKPESLNMDYIENYNNENINNAYPTYPVFGGNDNSGSSIAKQVITSPSNIINLSPTSAFIPKPSPFGDKIL